MRPITSKLILPNRIDYLDAVTAFTEEIAKLAGFEKQEVIKIHLALEEAIANVIQHGLEENPDEFFTILFEQAESELRIRIKAKGIPFDPDRMPVYSPDSPLEQSSGLGTFLMKKAMDEVRYINRGQEGMELCLVKHLKAQRIEKRLNPEEQKPFGSESQGKAPVDFSIRSLEPDDAIEVSKCAYRAYGYTYDEYIYYPEKIIENNRQGLMISFVAVTETGDLMGHLGLKFAFPGASVAEAGVTFVKPKYRKYGLAGQLNQKAIEKSREMKLAGISGRPVTSHLAIQKMSRHSGFIECGILLGDIPTDINFRKLVGQLPERGSEILCFLPLTITRSATLFPPTCFQKIVKQIFTRMEIPFSCSDVSQRSLLEDAGDPHIQLTMNSSFNLAEIYVAEFGKDDFDILKQMHRRLCLDRVDVINLFLNLEDLRCAGITEQLLSLGFFLAGVLPNGVADRHALILQYLNNVKLDYNLIKLYSKEARELLDIVLAGAPEPFLDESQLGE